MYVYIYIYLFVHVYIGYSLLAYVCLTLLATTITILAHDAGHNTSQHIHNTQQKNKNIYEIRISDHIRTNPVVLFLHYIYQIWYIGLHSERS